MPIDPLLAAARIALKAKQTAAAVKSIADAWRVVPAPELLELACALAAPEPLKAAKGKQTAEALKAARKGKRDPRVSRALEALLTDVPWTADSSKPVWREAFALAAALKDPRWVSLAESLPRQWKFRAPMAAWMGSQLKRAVAPLAEQQVPALSEAQSHAVRALLALAPRKTAAPVGQDAPALLAAVYAAPGDDAPRRVFADFLLEQGDPRGEFITLQLTQTPEAEKRAKKLLSAHGKQWLDGLTIAKDVRFHRGFLAKAKVTFKNQGEAEKYGALPAWATVEELELASSNNANDQRKWGQTIPPTAISLKRLSGLDDRGVENLCALKAPLPQLESIQGYVRDLEQWRALTESTLFPRLTSVDLSGLKPAWFAKAPPPDRWTQLGLGWSDLGPSYRAMAATKTQRFVWNYRDWATFEFSRGPQGDLSHLRLRMTKGNTPRQVKASLDELPEGCLESFDFEGQSDASIAQVRKRLVRAKGQAAAVVSGPVRTQGPVLALCPGEDGHVWWADRGGLIELDAAGQVVSDVAPAQWSSAAFSSDGRLVFGGGADVVEVFETRTGKRTAKLEVPCSTSYGQLSLSHDGRVLAAPMNPGVSVSWPGSKQKPAVYKGASCFTLTPDGKWLLRCDLTWGKGALQMHPVGEKSRGVKFAEDSPEFTAIACAPDGATFVTANAANELQLWDLASRTLVKTFEGGKRIIRLAFSDDGQRLAAGSIDQAWVFELATGQRTELKQGGHALAWTAEGKLLRGMNGKLLR